MKPHTPDVHADDAEGIEETEESPTPPPSSSSKAQLSAGGTGKTSTTSTDDHQRGDHATAGIAGTSNHNGDSAANNNNTTAGRKSMNNHSNNMANENNADAGTSAMGAPPRASGTQTHTNQMIGINGSVSAHSSYHTQNQTGHHFANNNNNIGAAVGHSRNTDSDDEDFGSASVIAGVGGVASGAAGTWGTARGSNSRAVSPLLNDNMSENSSQPPTMMPGQMVRSKSRPEMMPPSSRYNNTSFWKARRVLFYRNGDPYFPGVEYRFKPTRDISTLEALLEKITPKMDLPRGARYVFSMDGDRKYSLDELEDGASYVLSSFKLFKVSSIVLLIILNSL